MSNTLVKIGHECGTRDGLQVFEREDGGVDGYCYSCKTYVRHPFGDERNVKDIPVKQRIKKTREEIQAEIKEIADYGVVDLVDRRLRKDVLELYGIKIGVSEEDGKTPKFHYYPYYKNGELRAYKVRFVENKRMWTIGDQTDVDLFGWEVAKKSGARRLIITEGELDAAALHKILEMYTPEQYKDNIPAVCSLPHGAAAAGKDIARLMPEIRKYFKEVSLAFDNDDAGQRAVEDVCKIFPDATVINLPGKDANECLMSGKGKAAHKACTFNHQKVKNTRLVFGEDLHEEARKPAAYGELTWPWEHINKKTRGIRFGETIYIGAGVKMGKSELLNMLGAHFVKEHGVKVFMAKPEEANAKTYKLMCGKIAKKVFHDPEREFDFDAYDRAGEVLKDKLAMVNLYQHLGWETLKADIYAAAAWGAKVVFIDPITNLTNGMAAADANVKLQEIAQEISAMALDLNIVVFLFAHLKAPEGNLSLDQRQKKYKDGKFYGLGNCPHELGGDVVSSQFAGSRAMMRSCNLMLGLEGNKDPELPEHIRNLRNLRLLEDREFGGTGNFPLFWNKETTMFEEA
ncbi:DNA primase/helicase [Pseudomonas phage K4]|uniref:DNA primase/helicase n=1 Tax=Pseudomonas phage O4 TaxID=1784982 RepID=UPI00078D90D6|nr:DNA primase/helicase [Pseudomonas phage O4]AMO43521.1 putative helicase/primase [Pseudomonas phage O4]QWS69982.1 DNA primase/helicase [Pseudomonas phage K4]